MKHVIKFYYTNYVQMHACIVEMLAIGQQQPRQRAIRQRKDRLSVCDLLLHIKCMDTFAKLLLIHSTTKCVDTGLRLSRAAIPQPHRHYFHKLKELNAKKRRMTTAVYTHILHQWYDAHFLCAGHGHTRPNRTYTVARRRRGRTKIAHAISIRRILCASPHGHYHHHKTLDIYIYI